MGEWLDNIVDEQKAMRYSLYLFSFFQLYRGMTGKKMYIFKVYIMMGLCKYKMKLSLKSN